MSGGRPAVCVSQWLVCVTVNIGHLEVRGMLETAMLSH